jgi:hypothetical protein
LKRLNAAKWYLLIGVIAYGVFLLVNFPVSVAINGLQKIAPNLPVEISQPDGSIWNGQATITQPILGPTHIQWSLHIASLLTGSIALDLQAKSTKANIKTEIDLSQSNIVISNTKGSIYPSLINPLIHAQNAKMQGDITIDQLNAEISFDPIAAKNSQGQIVWQGGDVKYKNGRNQKTATLPIIIGRVSDNEGQLTMTLHEEDGTQIASAFVKPDGWAGAKIKRRLVDLVGEKIPGSSAPDTDIFELSEKIF